MNEMYSMSIGIHDAGVFLLSLLVLLNLVLLRMSHDIRTYAKRMRILMPLSASMIATIIFTGMVMMAAKRLDFSVENMVMIIFAIVLIVLDAKRYKTLKRSDPEDPDTFPVYKSKASVMMGIALVGIAAISAWMLA